MHVSAILLESIDTFAEKNRPIIAIYIGSFRQLAEMQKINAETKLTNRNCRYAQTPQIHP